MKPARELKSSRETGKKTSPDVSDWWLEAKEQLQRGERSFLREASLPAEAAEPSGEPQLCWALL